MEPILKGEYGNPSSIHRLGQKARAALVEATYEIASYFGVTPQEVLFTSGATEALNLFAPKEGHVITSTLEHPALLEPLKRSSAQVTYLDPPRGLGAIGVEQIREAIRPETTHLIFGGANSETGVCTPIDMIAELALEKNLHFFVDGVQLLGKEVINLHPGISAICFSGHKIHGPTGVGVVITRTPLDPLIVGGAQQGGRRAGSENLAAIVGLAKAISLLVEELPEAERQMGQLRDSLDRGLRQSIGDILVHGEREPRLCNTSLIAFPGQDAELLLMRLDLEGIAASYGSACSSGSLESSKVLRAMGVPSHVARSTLRFSLSRFTTEAEITQLVRVLSLQCLDSQYFNSK